MIIALDVCAQSVPTLRSWHVPDETWQSVEVAHRLVFGYGYFTWEWKKPASVRSFIHPLLFTPAMLLLRLLGLDNNRELLVLMPKVTQAMISAVGDTAIVAFAGKAYPGTRDFFVILYATNWFVNYCFSRTLVNSLEAALTNLALYFYPLNVRTDSGSAIYVALISLSFVVRPTTAILWLPLVLSHLWRLWKFNKNGGLDLLLQWLAPAAILTLASATVVDSCFYGKIIFVPWNFFKFNVLHSIGSFYGTHSWYWYVNNAWPIMTTGLGAPLVLLGLIRNWRSERGGLFAKTLVWTSFAYSVLPHKELRFLLPSLPLGLCVAADFLASKRIGKRTVAVISALLNIPLLLYLSLVHQRGALDVVSYLAENARSDSSVFFLMPCHSTPYWSHMHRSDIEMRFLTCEPLLQADSVDEADNFYSDPMAWLQKEFTDDGHRDLPTHLVLYDGLHEAVRDFLLKGGYDKCATFFHTHFPEGRISRHVNIYCKKSEVRNKPIL